MSGPPRALAFTIAVLIQTGLSNASAEDRPRSLADAYADPARRIIEAALAGNDAWRKMEELCDDIGHRLSGSESLERAVEWAVNRLAADGQENARTQPAMVPRWVRGEESAELIAPYEKSLAMLGLGGSVGTPLEGITAEVISVS